MYRKKEKKKRKKSLSAEQSFREELMFRMPSKLVIKCSKTDNYVIFTTLFHLLFLKNF